MPLPDSVQAVIAARLDTLDPPTKSLLGDAAVIGKVFWAGALAAIGERDPATVDCHARRARAARARRARAPLLDGRAKPSTRSATRSCATSPTSSSRAPRAPPVTSPRRHGSRPGSPTGSRTRPTYSPTTTPPRSSSLAPPTSPSRRPTLEAPALRFLTLAGRARPRPRQRRRPRELRARARAHPSRSSRRAEVLAGFGEAAHEADRETDAVAALEEAIDTFAPPAILASRPRRRRSSARPMCTSATRGGRACSTESLELLEPLPPGPSTSPC